MALIGIAPITMVVVATVAILFLYPYEPKKPPKADDTGFTSQGVKEVLMQITNSLLIYIPN
ncbi:MAG: hypothetical protein QXU40_01770 [Candidatus Pacearchaeota archaeon]